MLVSVEKAFDALWYYLSECEVFIEYDDKEECYIVDSYGGKDISKFHHIEDAFEWALDVAKGEG